MNTKMILRGAALVGVLAFAPGVMANTLQVLLYDGAYATGTTFQTCSGSSSVWAQASAWDSAGTLRCVVRQFNNNIWRTMSDCPAAATTQNTSLRSTGTAFCTSPYYTAWPGGHSCNVSNMWIRPNGGACVNGGTMFTFSNAF
jgi:hypothetical protein